MTLPEIRMEILSPTNETLATSTDMPKIQQAWDNAKAGGGKTGSMRIANDVEEVDHLDFKFPDVPDDTVFNYINDLRWSSGNADESVIRFQMESDGAIAVLADGAQITVLEKGEKMYDIVLSWFDPNVSVNLPTLQGGLNSSAAYGDKRDHPKIEIFVGGEYKATTTWASSCAEAKENYLAEHPEIDPSTVSCSFAPKKGSLKSASYEGLNPGEQSEARELELYADNTSEIYPLKESIILNIARKIKRGVYDPALAPKLWRYWIDAAAKRYAQEFATPDFSFSTKVRQAVADEYARNEYEMIMNGEYSDYLGKNGIELATPEEQEVPPTLSSLRTEAGLTTQIRSLKKRLDKLNINKCNPSEIKGVVDALEALEKRLEAEKVRKQKRLDAKESSDDDLEKEATSDEAQKWISSKIEKLINEGKSKEQAAAIAYSMAREKGFSIPEKKSGLEAVATSMVAKVISPFEVTVDDQTQVVNEGEIIEITNIFPDFYEGKWQGKTVFVEPEIFDSLTEPAEGAEVYAEKKEADQVPPAPPMESATPGNKWVMDPTTKQWTQVPESDQTVEMKATASLKVEAVKDEYSIFG